MGTDAALMTPPGYIPVYSSELASPYELRTNTVLVGHTSRKVRALLFKTPDFQVLGQTSVFSNLK